MSGISDNPGARARFTTGLVEKLRYARVDPLSNVELLIILNQTGDFLTRTEIRQIARDWLLEQKNEVCRTGGQMLGGPRDYERAIEDFLDDLLSYAASNELKAAIASEITRERRDSMKEQFLRRMVEAADAGILQKDLILVPTWVPPQQTGLRVSNERRPALVAAVLAFVFAHWIASNAAAHNDDLTEIVALSQSSEDLGMAASEHLAATADDKIRGKLDILFKSVTLGTPEDCAHALDELASMGPEARPVLPALRERLTLSDPTSRWEAAWAIGNISQGTPDDVAALINALDDENERVRDMAALALGRMGPAAKESLSKLARQPSSAAAVLAKDCISSGSDLSCKQVESIMVR